MYKRFGKRILDFCLSLLFILILLPVYFVLGIVVGLNMGFPVIFTQPRVGKDCKVFNIYKFRTMTNVVDDKGKPLPDEKRITGFGRFLRGSSLDELPELYNILKGDLSFVGPRPLLVSYLPYYTEYEKQRHLVRGGLTVPEVLYDNFTPTWEEQFSYEVEYAQKMSFWLDVK